ncbi:hypothetical protein H2200_000631 [Cladophialophora chaetospira]|uniref:Transcription factor domain-containing protein n=1 Tax=Cladophialophora chaetospira TaxID=386627 RepID=A0AA38XPN0_9EURO|nr:hypothetical protein H2200_000631 [Cladophialophora chaetospira]
MMLPNQPIFIQGTSSGRSRNHLQSNARSHAARVGHLRLKASTKSKDDASSVRQARSAPGQAIVPIRTQKVQHPPWRTKPYKLAPIQDPFTTPPRHPDVVPHYSHQAHADGDYPREEEQLEHTTESITSVAQTSPPVSYRTAPLLFNVSLAHEGFPGLRTDPFLCLPETRDSRIWSAIDFYTQIICAGNDTIFYVFDVLNVYASFLETLQDNVFFDVGVGRLLFIQEQICNPGRPPSAYTLKHRGKALAEIRNKLSRLDSDSNVDDVTLTAMVFLAVLDKGLLNIAEYDLHRRSIGLIVSRQGGLKRLRDGSMLKGLLLHYDTQWSKENGETILPGEGRRYEPIYPTQPGLLNLCLSATKGQLGFHQLVTENALSFSILRILFRAIHITSLNPRGRSELLTKTRQSPKRYNDFWEACPGLRTSDTSVSVFEKLLSLTLICYCYIAFGSRFPQTHLRASSVEATELIGSYFPKTQAEEDCLIWMWIIIIDSWRLGNRLQPGGISLLFDLQLRFPAYRHVSAVTDLANRFLWTADLNASVHMYWADLASPG